MLRKEKRGIACLEFSLLQGLPVRHALFLRCGGCSPPPYDTLNCGVSSGDERKNVEENLRRALEVLGFSKTARSRIVHGDSVFSVATATLPESLTADGLSTAELFLPLTMTYADCQVAFFYDRKNHVIANVHAGWRGNLANIYGKAVDHLWSFYGSRPEELLVGISPSLDPAHAFFPDWEQTWPPSLWSYRREGSDCFDLWRLALDQLQESGIPREQIEIASTSTYEDVEGHFSYRRDQGTTGRHAAVIALLPQN